MQIAFFETHDWEVSTLEKMLAGHSPRFDRGKIQEIDLTPYVESDVISVFIYSKVDRVIIDKFPHLKLVVTRSTGFDHIDLAVWRARGVRVCNVPAYGENTVAEHTFALILSLSRNIHKSYVRVSQGNFTRDGLVGFDLKGRTLGVIGAGHIGLHVIKIARGFGMNVLAADTRQDHFLAELLNFRYATVEELLAQSDIISLHLPYSEATHHFLNAERFRMVRKGALLINTARGSLVDTAALLQALDDGTLAGAGLDVLEGEQYINEEQELLRSERLPVVLGVTGIVRYNWSLFEQLDSNV